MQTPEAARTESSMERILVECLAGGTWWVAGGRWWVDHRVIAPPLLFFKKAYSNTTTLNSKFKAVSEAPIRK